MNGVGALNLVSRQSIDLAIKQDSRNHILPMMPTASEVFTDGFESGTPPGVARGSEKNLREINAFLGLHI